MPLTRIEQLLKDTMGLNAASIGTSAVRRAVELRMEALHITDPHRYYERLQSSRQEIHELIELVVIPETWFFRDWHPFEALLEQIEQDGRLKRTDARLRILSAPCSTGEEPYTIAMALHARNVARERVRIDAVDISQRSIDSARLGIYRDNSFRGQGLDFRDRYFHRVEGGYHLDPDIREWVHFQQDNILNPAFVRDRTPYDIIFCRNLLIYFDRPTQNRLIDNLEQLLNPDGLLFTGHAESGVLVNRCFTSLKYPRSFAFRYTPDAPSSQRPAVAAERKPSRSVTRPVRRRPSPPPRKEAQPPRWVEAEEQAVAPPRDRRVADTVKQRLDEATALADDGHLVEAANVCEAIMAEHGPNAHAFYLLGLIRDATGNTGAAEDLLRKAVYMDPDHCPAMVHLALVLERRGDKRGAEQFRERAERCQQRRQEAEA